jgi:hypothetical protein
MVFGFGSKSAGANVQSLWRKVAVVERISYYQ